MPASAAVLLLTALSLAQSPAAPGDPARGDPVPRTPHRRFLVPEDGAPPSASADPPARRLQPADARLADVWFVDRWHGWAVGDFGVILRTDDGEHWSPQVSGVSCALTSVCFVDAHNGWAAGGMAYPYLHDSAGVVLSTRDGGLNWEREPVLLPALRKIRFWNQRQGWAIGRPSAMFPGGVFLTRDAGRSWQPACSEGTACLLTGDFFDARHAILGGSLGLTAAISDGDFARNPRAGAILPGSQAMQVVPPDYGWLAGDGGWIAVTVNRGESWRPPLGELPPGTAQFDFSALAVRGPKCWIAGSPGSRVFFTPDAGKTWSAFPTRSTVPLRAITFVDDRHGWAVGQLGLILSSDDGGKTWRKQRSGGARAAVMAVAGWPHDLPLELLARICKDQGHLGIAEVLGRADVQAAGRGDGSAGERLHEAVVQVGASAGETAWGFPVRPPCLLLPAQAVLDDWNRAHAGHGNDALLAYVVRQIRTWRPSVILVPAGRGNQGLSGIVQQTVVAATKLAGDPDYLADQFVPAGCGPWNVQQLYLVSDTVSPLPSAVLGRMGEGGHHVPMVGVRALGKIVLAADDWSSRLGQTWADAALHARGLLDDEYQPSPAEFSVQSIAAGTGEGAAYSEAEIGPRVGDARNRFDIMSGIAAIGGPSRRPAAEAENDFGGTLDGLALGRQVQLVFENVRRDPQAVLDRLAQGSELPPGINASAAAALTFRIAQRFLQIGRRDLADKTLALLIERYPLDPLARWALVWRLQGLAASEIPEVEEAPRAEPAAAGNKVGWAELRRVPPIGVEKAVALVERATPSSDGRRVLPSGGGGADAVRAPKSRAEQSVLLARQIEVDRPDLFASPAVRYPLAAVYRQLGQDALAQRLYALDPRGVDRDAWWSCARGEAWLPQRKGDSPKPIVTCVAASERPHLDGRLDEPLWKKCPPIVLASPLGDDRAWPASVMLAHDEQYLYLAIQCRQAAGARYEVANGRRPRHADLTQHDRVAIFLDLDRDYATYYRFAIDHRGWADEARCGDRSWNPQWFIAAETAGGVWTAEAAIPLAELHAAIVPGKTVWALGVQRTVPGVGFQSWTSPADAAVVPEGFGWLGFER